MKYAMERPKTCPGCGSSYFREGTIAWDWIWEREDHHEIINWQCLNCGALVEKRVMKLEIVAYEPICLTPGELQLLRTKYASGKTKPEKSIKDPDLFA